MEAGRGPDGRPLPWIACDLPLDPSPGFLNGNGRVVGLSMDAVRLTDASGLSEGLTVRVAFRLPGQRAAIALAGRAAHVTADGSSADILIEAFEGNAERTYRQHVLARAGAEALDRQAEALRASAASLVPISDPTRIREILADALAFRADVLLGGADLPAPLRATLVGVEAPEVLVEVEGGLRGAPLAGARVRCSLLTRHGPYLFEGDVRGRLDGRLWLALPERLHQYEKRGAPRTPVHPERDAPGTRPADRIVIPLPPAYGGPIERPLIDVSAAGAAFRSQPGDPLFLPGTPLPGVVLVRGGEPGAPRPAEVRQVAAESGGASPTYRVGLALDVERGRVSPGAAPAAPPVPVRPGPLARLASAAGAARAGLAARPRLGWLLAFRRSPEPAGPLVNVMRYRGRDREEIVALVNSTRPLGRRGLRLRGPLVVIPPPFARTKETFCALALMLVETFRRAGQDVVVVRYDGVRSVGESHKDADDWAEGRQMMRYTLSQGAADLLATVDHFHSRPWFRPTHTVVVSFSLAALAARRAILDDRARRVTHWVSVVGAVDAQDAIFNVTGGIDLVGGHQMGLRYGVMPVLGHMGDVDAFAADAIAAGLATLADARRDLAKVPVPISWFVGRDDRWIRAERVHEAMSVAAPAPRAVIELPIGHTMRSSAEALASFETITRHLWAQLHGDQPADVRLDPALLKRAAARERGRMPRRRLEDARQYWEAYLLGDDRRGLGLDLWATTPAYRELMDLQRQLLDVAEGDVVADLGTGTGNFLEHLLDRLVRNQFRTSPKRIIAADLVPAALAVAKRKAAAVTEGVLLPAEFLEFREVNLETSRLRPVRRFLNGELASIDGLRGLVDGLPDDTLDRWLGAYDERLHAWLRGAAPDGPLRQAAGRALKGIDLEVAVEFNRAARWALGRLVVEDFATDDPTAARARLADPRRIRASDLRFAHLRLEGPGVDDALPFPDASLDRVVLSLVISYLPDPLEVLREVYRTLRPGGRVVASSLRPDADMSRTVEELVERVAKDEAAARRFGLSPQELTRALQAYLNHAAGLVDLEEVGVFRFFSREDFAQLFEGAGFEDVKVHESFGRPPQAFVAVGVKR